jgi:hypothetical protein
MGPPPLPRPADTPNASPVTQSPVNPSDLIRFHPLNSDNKLLIDFLIKDDVYNNNGWSNKPDGWQRRWMRVSLINLNTQPIEPMSIIISSGHVETKEGVSYEVEDVIGDVSDNLPLRFKETINLDPLFGNPLPTSIPMTHISIFYKYAETSTPTRLVLNTSLGDIYTDLPLVPLDSIHPFQQNTQIYMAGIRRPIDEWGNIFNVTVSENENIEIQRMGNGFTVINKNSLEEESASLTFSHATFFSCEHFPYPDLECDKYSSNVNEIRFDSGDYTLKENEPLKISLGPGQTKSGSCAIGRGAYRLVLLQNGLYAIY